MADAIAQSMITVLACGIFMLMMLQKICITELSEVLDMVANSLIDNLGGNNTHDNFHPTVSQVAQSCGNNTATMAGSDFWYGLSLIGPSSSPRFLSNPFAQLNPRSLANLTNLPPLPKLHNTTNIYVPLIFIPENVARLYGILLALPQEIQAYFGVALIYLALFVATMVIESKLKPQHINKRKYKAYTLAAAQFAKGMHKSIGYSKWGILAIAGLALLVFRQTDLLPQNTYNTTLWDAAWYYLKHWGTTFVQALQLSSLQNDPITAGSEEAAEIQLAITAWGTAWTAFLAWAPIIMLASMLYHGYYAYQTCKKEELSLTTKVSTQGLFCHRVSDEDGESEITCLSEALPEISDDESVDVYNLDGDSTFVAENNTMLPYQRQPGPQGEMTP